MVGPGSTSSDILGIEVGREVVRGVRLDQETTELTAAAECAFDPAGVGADGIIDPALIGPALDVLIHRLGVDDRSQIRVGLTIGPRNAGVGSGPAMAAWMQEQAANLGESLTCSGGLGIAFVPSRSIDAAVKLGLGCGIDLVRIDLAPVAGARAIGDQVEDLICLGSGRGWQARMRDFEVLEAMENGEVSVDAPLAIVRGGVPPRAISRYGWVEISAALDQAQRLEIGQLAPAVGVAIGVAYESPANLLLGTEVSGVAPPQESAPATPAALTGYEFGSPDANVGAEATLQLAKIDTDARPRVEPPQHKARAAAHAGPVNGLLAEPQTAPNRELPPASPAPGAKVPVERPQRVLPPRTGGGTGPGRADAAGHQAAQPGATGSAGTAQSSDDLWGGAVDESDPIAMFSPDTDVRHMMGKRDSRLGPDVVFVLLLVSAVVLLLAYLYI